MDIQTLYKEYNTKVATNEIFAYGKDNNHDLFLAFRKANQGLLSEADELFLTQRLKDEQERWFVPHVLSVTTTFSEHLMKAVLEAAILVEDPSFNNNFLHPCVRVFDLKVNDYLHHRFQTANKKERIGILRAFYWVRSRITTVLHYADDREETYGKKYIWAENEFTDRDHRPGIEKEAVSSSIIFCTIRCLIPQFFLNHYK